MVIYDLICANHHIFEGWFKDSEDFQAQQEAGLVSCPACDNNHVSLKESKSDSKQAKSTESKMIDSSKSEVVPITAQEKASILDIEIIGSEIPSDIHFTSTTELVEIIRSYIEKNLEDVGDNLVTEMRKMHYGESEQRAIRGFASDDEVADLADDGIELYSIPINTKAKKDLN